MKNAVCAALVLLFFQCDAASTDALARNCPLHCTGAAARSWRWNIKTSFVHEERFLTADTWKCLSRFELERGGKTYSELQIVDSYHNQPLLQHALKPGPGCTKHFFCIHIVLWLCLPKTYQIQTSSHAVRCQALQQPYLSKIQKKTCCFGSL